ncbi:hypothetical protein AB0953_05470 [Streptomyces sp. NPDC046866]|uniref:hypothetical protein n=1 Tax=Streptomyces sp. NPDC046866 TaxID=3154921 RepID=UPI0034567839
MDPADVPGTARPARRDGPGRCCRPRAPRPGRGLPYALLALAATVLASGCGAPAARTAGAQDSARAFAGAVAGGDFRAACALLAPRTRQELEQDEQKPCALALAGQDLPRAAARTVHATEVYGRQAMVRLGEDTLFLSEFGGGWRVVAAGCRPEADEPYRCAVKGN